MIEIVLEDGKYTILHENGANLRVLRYGESWGRDIVGDGLILALVNHIENLQEELDNLTEWDLDINGR